MIGLIVIFIHGEIKAVCAVYLYIQESRAVEAIVNYKVVANG
jgi:hypothetical protein